jgi:hypothetical protein
MIKMTFYEQQGRTTEENETWENKNYLPDCHITFRWVTQWEFWVESKDCQEKFHP